MKRKPLSMKKLYQYANDYLNELYLLDIDGERGISPAVKESLELKHIMDFIDYIWKNPK